MPFPYGTHTHVDIPLDLHANLTDLQELELDGHPVASESLHAATALGQVVLRRAQHDPV